MFETCLPLRTVSPAELGKVLADIDSHMPANHIYSDSDKITWGHETTHGINSRIRNIHGPGVNAFYVLNNKAAIVKEPNTTMREVAKEVPESLRGNTYQLYLIDQANSWNNTPLYILDEWTAYTNGSAVRFNLDIITRSETILSMLEFNIYSICVGIFTDNTFFKEYLKFGIERAMQLYRYSKIALSKAEEHDAYLDKMRTSSDAKSFREFTQNYLGEEWVDNILDF